METSSFEATGTLWVISLPQNAKNSTIVEKIKARVEEFEQTYSRFRKNSLTNKLSSQTGNFELPSDAKELFDVYLGFAKLTNEVFTPLIGQNLTEAGYDSEYSFKSKALTALPKISAVLEYKFPKITIKKPVQLDFGAAGKGYIIDLVGKLIESEGISEYCVDAGHDILVKSSKKLRIGLEHPSDPSKVIGLVEISNGAICGSAGNRRKWEKFNHIINPLKKESPQDIVATWVIAERAIIADAISTCLFFVDPKTLEKFHKFEYLILYADFSFSKSANFSGEIFHA